MGVAWLMRWFAGHQWSVKLQDMLLPVAHSCVLPLQALKLVSSMMRRLQINAADLPSGERVQLMGVAMQALTTVSAQHYSEQGVR